MTTPRPDRPAARRILSAELFAVGSELTAGETRDTNGGELGRSLSIAGVTVRRIAALPDDLGQVTAAFSAALEAVDLVVATGGLGPTPDDLTREAIAAAVGEEPAIDPGLEAWLRDLFARRGVALPAANLKQAWTIPSSTPIPNANGTAPGWWVDRPDGRIAVLLPGPPREMRAMWTGWALPRLRERGLGDGRLVRTLRTYGIGESVVAERLGEAMLRASNPVVATYARADWLDVRISATDVIDGSGRVVEPAADLLARTENTIRASLEGYVWADDETSWADLVAAAARRSGTRLATVEAGTRGALAELLAEVPALDRAVVLGPAVEPDPASWPVEAQAAEVAREAGVEIGLALVARTDSATQTVLRAAVAAPDGGWCQVLDLRLFQHGAHGRLRAAVAAAAFIVQVLDERGSGAPGRLAR
ncbi:MAG: competence/damage-inducible protein [Chloroflexi bacterium]|nr:competence/damage-inducible protein [Chloroflexota bacterium]